VVKDRFGMGQCQVAYRQEGRGDFKQAKDSCA